eukprot:1156026-Pelagomonas_calceolata.AAC.11
MVCGGVRKRRDGKAACHGAAMKRTRSEDTVSYQPMLQTRHVDTTTQGPNISHLGSLGFRRACRQCVGTEGATFPATSAQWIRSVFS